MNRREWMNLMHWYYATWRLYYHETNRAGGWLWSKEDGSR